MCECGATAAVVWGIYAACSLHARDLEDLPATMFRISEAYITDGHPALAHRVCDR